MWAGTRGTGHVPDKTKKRKQELERRGERITSIALTAVSDDPITRVGLENIAVRSNLVAGAEAVAVGGFEALVQSGELGDLIVIDSSFDQYSHANVARIVTACVGRPTLAVIDDTHIGAAAMVLDAGASGIITRSFSLGMLNQAITRLREGDNYLEPRIARVVVREIRELQARRKARDMLRMTLREEQVAKALMSGHTNRQIAESLSISEKTVKHYVGILKDKLNAANRLEIVLEAQRLQLFA